LYLLGFIFMIMLNIIFFYHFFIDALRNLIDEAKTDVYKLAFSDDSKFVTNKWSDIQFWEIMKGLSKKKHVLYQIFFNILIYNHHIVY
jgi:hypothetical protein